MKTFGILNTISFKYDAQFPKLEMGYPCSIKKYNGKYYRKLSLSHMTNEMHQSTVTMGCQDSLELCTLTPELSDIE